MKGFYTYYQYLAPLVILPFSIFLWWHRFSGNVTLLAYVLMLPIVTAYVIPALGTNVTKLWAFNTRFKMGKFRPHHGFVFGSATSLLSYLALTPETASIGFAVVLQTGFIMAAVLGFWNWIYDIYAIKSGHIEVYNKQSFEGQGPEAIATDYAPIYFSVFGFVYGVAIRLGQIVLTDSASLLSVALIYSLGLLILLLLPTTIFAVLSHKKNGYSGVYAYKEHLKRTQ